MTAQFGCQSQNVVYLATCEQCKIQYVGQTGRKLHERIMEHLRYIKSGINALGIHYLNSRRCESGRDLKFQVIEKVYPELEANRLQRESFWIRKLDTKESGLNTLG